MKKGETNPGERGMWHRLTADEVLQELGSGAEGLSSKVHQKRLAENGPNRLPSGRKVTLAEIILHQFASPLIYVLLGAAIFSIILKEYSDAFFIGLILFFNALIGSFQEWKAESGAQALQAMVRVQARVRRNGRLHLVDAEDLVPGDVVLLESGQTVPADLRLLETNNMSIEEALLTGESVAVQKDAHKVPEENAAVGDRVNMAFAGTMVNTGRAKGVVVATALRTELGKIADHLHSVKAAQAPLVLRMERFAKKISIIVLVACALLGVEGYFRGIPIDEIFFFIVAIAVSAIPEGLPIAMTVALSIGTSRMARRQVIVRKLTAVEGLGSCTMIATDKTGTLTVDQQTVRKIILPGEAVAEVSGQGYNGEGEIRLHEESKENLEKFIEAVSLCNEAALSLESDGWQYNGDAVDVALLALSYKNNSSPENWRRGVERVKDIPFESALKYAAVYYRKHGKRHLAVKGAAEVLLAHCPNEREDWGKLANQYAGEGYRILAVATAEVDEIGNELPEMKMLGLVALIDPPRTEAKAAIAECHAAGIAVCMITGDHPATALAIAQQLNLATEANQLITGKELTPYDASQPAFAEIIRNKRVFARVSPEQKQQIVSAMQALGHFVAVTGDGVNDAPALKSANIGVAMGYGTDVAKDVAGIIVADNNFTSIAAGVEEGRYTYANLRKIIYLLISTGAAEILMIGLALGFNTPLPFLPVQLLWLNLVTNGIQDVALAFEKGEKHQMLQRPRKPEEGIFNKLMISETLVSAAAITAICFGLWYHLLNNLEMEEFAARNIVLLLMVLLQNFHVVNCRSETKSMFRIPLANNYVLFIGILIAQGIHIASLHIPVMQNLLSLQPVTLSEWWKLLLTASIILVVMELFKLTFSKSTEKVKV